MGSQDVQANMTPEQRSRYMKALLTDVHALEYMLAHRLFEEGVCRIGAEQELVLVDRHWQPAPLSQPLLDAIGDDRLTTEVAKFNLEANLSPRVFTGDCLRRTQEELEQVIGLVREACRAHRAEVVLCGILPTLAVEHLGRSNITERARYFALNDVLTALRGGRYELNIKGVDELNVHHDTVMLEALNTSFQLHYQTGIDDFAPRYNLAQALAGPLLASAANSPVLFGKRLWRETRIAVFEQTVDTRTGTPSERELLARVRFGEGWVDRSVLEIFKSDISRFRVILGREIDESPIERLQAGQAPRLQALQMFNSTVYRWNRACYGVSEGKPHLRIENRIYPSGPTVLDEMANAAMWFGLLHGGLEAYGDIRRTMRFDDARMNFIAAARQGLNAEVIWREGEHVAARDLLLEELLPIAREGLVAARIDDADIDRLLGVVRERIESRHTGAQWMLDSIASMQGTGTRSERAAALTAAIVHRQHPCGDEPARPVHRWTPATLSEGGGWIRSYQRVGQYMTTELFTVHADDTLDLVVTLMDWEHIRHVPVEDEDHRLIGIVSYRPLLKHLARSMLAPHDKHAYSVSVREIMRPNPVTVTPETTTLEAIALMRERKVSCLPVVKDGRLVGIITEHDFIPIASKLIEDTLRMSADDDEPAAAPTTTTPAPDAGPGSESPAPDATDTPIDPAAPVDSTAPADSTAPVRKPSDDGRDEPAG